MAVSESQSLADAPEGAEYEDYSFEDSDYVEEEGGEGEEVDNSNAEEGDPEAIEAAAKAKREAAYRESAERIAANKLREQEKARRRCCISYARVVSEEEQRIKEQKYEVKEASVNARKRERQMKAANAKKIRADKPYRKTGIYESTTCWKSRTVLHFKEADANGVFKGEGFNEKSGYCFINGQWIADGDRVSIFYRDRFGTATMELSWETNRGFAEYVGNAEYNKGRASFSKIHNEEALDRDFQLIKDYALRDLKAKVAIISSIKDNLALRMRAMEEAEAKKAEASKKAAEEAAEIANLQARAAAIPAEIEQEKADKLKKPEERPRPVKEINNRIEKLKAEQRDVDKALKKIESEKKKQEREAVKAVRDAERAAKAAAKKGEPVLKEKASEQPPHALLLAPRGFLSDRRFVIASFIEDETAVHFAARNVLDDPYFRLIFWHFQRLPRGGEGAEAFKVLEKTRDASLPDTLDRSTYEQLKCWTDWKDLSSKTNESGEVTSEVVLKTIELEKASEKEKWLSKVEISKSGLDGAPRYLTADFQFMVRAAAIRPEALQYADKELICDYSFMVQVVQNAARSMIWAAEELKSNRSFLLDVASSCDVQSLEHADPKLVKDPNFLKEARRASADGYNRMPDEKRRLKQFSGYGSLNAALDNDSTAVVLASYLTKLSDRGLPLKHRRNLPKSAFYHGAICHAVTVVALSYTWATRDNPDVDGEQLADLARFLRFLMKDETRKGKTVVVFWDWVSLYQNKPDGSRSDRETDLYGKGRASSNIWYAHKKTITVLNTKKPKHRDFAYDKSGWPYFEKAVSNLGKSAALMFDLVKFINWQDAESEKTDNGTITLSYGDMVEASSADRTLPWPPAPINKELSEKKFTFDADKDFLRVKYVETFEAMMQMQESMNYEDFKAPKQDWKQLVSSVLSNCSALTDLNMSRTDLQVDIREIIEEVGGPLKILKISETGCSGDLKVLAKAPNLEVFDASKTRIAGNISVFKSGIPNIQHLNLSFSATRGYFDELCDCKKLKYINLKESRCMGDKRVLARSLPDCKEIIVTEH